MRTKLKVSLVLMIVLLVLSTIFNTVKPAYSFKENLPKEAEGKRVVNLWLKASSDMETRQYQMEKFNRENRDNIYINYKFYREDYTNMLKVSLVSENRPDLFQYGYSLLFIRDEVEKLDEFGVDIDRYGKDKFLYYNGTPYGVTLTANNVKLVWNKDIFKAAGLDPEKPPKSWSELIEIAEIIKAKNSEVVPFEFPYKGYEDIKTSIGEPSVNSGDIYHSFWDYKTGKYNFDYAKDILEVYNRMYSSELIERDFFNKTRKDVRIDFYTGKAAMIISTYEDRDYFTNSLKLDFDMGVTDLPLFKEVQDPKYYTVDSFNNLVVRKEVEDTDAVKLVLDWLMSKDVNEEILHSGSTMPLILGATDINETEADNYYKGAKFENAIYDPTPYISYNGNEVKELIYSAINGSNSIDKVIEKLNSNFDTYYNRAEKDSKFNFDLYIEKNN
jgi:ABC-type glycerol-3-phosphate transport system substrate-binding protein